MLLKKGLKPAILEILFVVLVHHRNSNPSEPYKNDKQVQADDGQSCAPKDVE